MGILYDYGFDERPGGAQRLADRIVGSVPIDSVDLIPCPPGAVDRECETYVALLTKLYSNEELNFLVNLPSQAKLVRYEQDYWRDFEGQAKFRDKLNAHADLVCFVSPLHQQMYGLYHPHLLYHGPCLAPPLDPNEFVEPRLNAERVDRAIWFGEWQIYKAPDLAQKWALETHTHLDLYSPTMPQNLERPNNYVQYKGFVPQDRFWAEIARHKTFVHFPRQPEPWPYSVLEAYLLGCEIIISGRFGCESFGGGLDRAVELASTSADDFWDAALNV